MEGTGERRVSCVLRDSVWNTDKIFDYLVPAELCAGLCPGLYAEVPFGGGNRSLIALILSVSEDISSEYPLKSILRILDPLPVMQEDQLALLDFIRFRYSCTYGDAMRLLVPAVVSTRKEKVQSVVFLKDREAVLNAFEEGDIKTLPTLHLLEALLESEEIPLQELLQMLSISRSPIDTLKKKGWIGVEKRPVVKEEEKQAEVSEDYPEQPESLTPAQADAVQKILFSGDKEFLLYGITGSGKTEVYLRAAQEVLDKGGSVLFLVPEISLTPQMIRWVKGRFEEDVSVIHSQLTPSEKYEQWDAIRKGKTRIVVGARSAAFAPLRNLCLILMDEEQDSSYKSDIHPRYHARDILRMRARKCGATLVLGSATPSVETFYSANEGYTKLLPLPTRAVEAAVLPSVEIVDMREELRRGNRSVLSRSLHRAIEEALFRKEQVLLFLNRRGYSGLLLCRSCGESISCEHCSVPLNMHRPRRMKEPVLICHYCGQVREYPKVCPFCESKLLGKMGVGTQQLEEFVKGLFPEAGVLRMDQDTTSSRGAHERIIRSFRNREADILIGTQMIAKGHDFPAVTVVGILSADILLRSSDFRAQERGFQLLTQAAGRAGRSGLPGRVFFQTYQPEDDALKYAAKQDYPGFYHDELEFRRRLAYPPFCAFGSVQIASDDEEKARELAGEVRGVLVQIVEQLPERFGVHVYDAAPAAMYRVRDKFRYRIFIKAGKKSQLSQMFRALQTCYAGRGVSLQTDIDPL